MKYSLDNKTPNIHETVYIAPGAHIIGDVNIKEKCSVWFNAVLRGDNEKITVGEESNIQDGTVVHSDPGYPVVIGNQVTIGHNAIIHGCTIKNGALIGMGSTILNGATIGEGALVAAGSLVREGMVIEPGMLVAGVPAKPIKKLSETHIENLKDGAKHYVENGSKFSLKLTRIE
jgi:carbonic anhydrase/acetyltransferase-like protein (isoleucine patch superfamily)